MKFYRIIAYKWDEQEPVAVIDLVEKSNAMYLFGKYYDIAVQAVENISILELYEMNPDKNSAIQIAATMF